MTSETRSILVYANYLAAVGVGSDEPIAADEQLVLADLVNVDAPTDYVLGTRNFYAITRYNRSYFYAMAVIDLADALRGRRSSQGNEGREGSQP